MGLELSELAARLLDGPTFAVLCTINPDGSPQSSVIWVKRDDDTVVFSTIRGRRKALNMQRDPRVSICLYNPDNPLLYAEIRGSAAMDETGGAGLIDELSRKYTGNPWPDEPPERVRVVCRVSPTKVFSR
jgi:PPOX class probable F420-dependent enzyme